MNRFPSSLIDSLIPKLEVPHELCEVLQGCIVMVHVREGGVVAVNVEGDGEQLRHDAVVGDQGGEAGVDLHETLKPR